jgi:hypothetical protein
LLELGLEELLGLGVLLDEGEGLSCSHFTQNTFILSCLPVSPSQNSL